MKMKQTHSNGSVIKWMTDGVALLHRPDGSGYVPKLAPPPPDPPLPKKKVVLHLIERGSLAFCGQIGELTGIMENTTCLLCLRKALLKKKLTEAQK